MGLKFNPNLYIPIEFIDKDGTVHTARSWDELTAKVIGYRERRRIPSGNPFKEIVHQACAKVPGNCIDDGSGIGSIFPGLNSRILHWIGNLVSTIRKLGFVSAEEAASRAKICAACPRQQAWADTCAACRTQVNNVAKELLGSRTLTPEMKSLKGCNALGEDTRVSIWLTQATVEDDELPDNCWRKA